LVKVRIMKLVALKKTFWALLVLCATHGASPVNVEAGGSDYLLYKNPENFGIVVFPKRFMFKELEEFIGSMHFAWAESGKAVMRPGSLNNNTTFMMPQPVQEKHGIEQFVVLQILTSGELMVAVFDPEWGLTLPSAVFDLEEVKKNLPQTLNIFRKNNPKREILWDHDYWTSRTKKGFSLERNKICDVWERTFIPTRSTGGKRSHACL